MQRAALSIRSAFSFPLLVPAGVFLTAGLIPLVPSLAASSEPSSRVVLVELFTSEGCSSCPPADALLQQVNGTRTASGQLIVGLSEHVTYWNDLGWVDPFSSSIYTSRQGAYVSRLQLESAYTPQMVVNGSEEFVGSNRNALLEAMVKEGQRPPSVDLRILSASVSEGQITVSFSAADHAARGNVDLMAAISEDTAHSKVARGENSGRFLTHAAVAQTLTRVETLQTRNSHTVRIALPEGVHPDRKHHLVLFAQLPEFGRVVAADTVPF